MSDSTNQPSPAVVKKQCKRLSSMYYAGWRFKPSHLRGYAKEMAFAMNLAAEARLVVTAQNSGDELSLWVEGTPAELDAFFKHMGEVRDQKLRKAEAIKKAKDEARRLVKQAQSADYSNPTPSPIVGKPTLVAHQPKDKGERVM